MQRFYFNITINKRVLMVSNAYWGACNDKEICKDVEETKLLLQGKYEHICYTLYDIDGNQME